MTHSTVLYQRSPISGLCVCEIISASISTQPAKWPPAVQYGIYEANQWEGKQ